MYMQYTSGGYTVWKYVSSVRTRNYVQVCYQCTVIMHFLLTLVIFFVGNFPRI